jgi:hypothetical protein
MYRVGCGDPGPPVSLVVNRERDIAQAFAVSQRPPQMAASRLHSPKGATSQVRNVSAARHETLSLEHFSSIPHPVSYLPFALPNTPNPVRYKLRYGSTIAHPRRLARSTPSQTNPSTQSIFSQTNPFSFPDAPLGNTATFGSESKKSFISNNRHLFPEPNEPNQPREPNEPNSPTRSHPEPMDTGQPGGVE